MTIDPSTALRLQDQLQRITVYAEAVATVASIVLVERERDGEPSEQAWKMLHSAVASYERARKELGI